jgi:hypothetical protein
MSAEGTSKYMTQSVARGIPRTAAEISEGVTPVDYSKPPGNVLRYGTNTTPGTTDMTAAIQAAIDCNLTVYFPPGTYACQGLTADTNTQGFYADTVNSVILQRNSAGDILSITANDVVVANLDFRGEDGNILSGDNLVLDGVRNTLIQIDSSRCTGRALKCDGRFDSLRIDGGHFETDSSASTDAPAIVLGDDANTNSSLYCSITDVRFNKSACPLTAYGMQTSSIKGTQIGGINLHTASGGAVTSGVSVFGVRITGDCSIDGSNHIFTGNVLGAYDFEFTGGGKNVWVGNDEESGHTMINNGNANTTIIRQVSSGSTNDVRFGDDNDAAYLYKISPASGDIEYIGHQTLPNDHALRGLDSGGTARNIAGLSSGDDFQFGNNNGTNFTTVFSGTGGVYASVGGNNKVQFDNTATAGNTAMLLYDVDNATVERVTVGAADSGGSGYKVLRIPN